MMRVACIGTVLVLFAYVHNEIPSVGWAQVAKEQKKRENRAKQRRWGKSRKAFTTKMTYVRELS